MPDRLSRKIQTSIFWTKLTHWEFWPFEIVYFPVYFYWTWLAIRARSFFFFSSSNPGIEYGGMLGESKYDIHKILPQEYCPTTVFMKKNSSMEEVQKVLDENHLTYPVILKPNIGERGWFVSKIQDEKELSCYLANVPVDFLIQRFVDLPVELGVFYYRYPGREEGRISSIVQKKMLTVVGNGKDTIFNLMQDDPRARLQIRSLKTDNPALLTDVPGKGQAIELIPIGNHSRGTTFLNANDLINEQLIRVFDTISKQIKGFYFGRFDIRCASHNDLYNGKFVIMELNGAGAEPGHIYHPGASLLAAYQSIFFHLTILFEISRENKKRGVPFMTFKEGISFIKKIRAYSKFKSLPKPEKV